VPVAGFLFQLSSLLLISEVGFRFSHVQHFVLVGIFRSLFSSACRFLKMSVFPNSACFYTLSAQHSTDFDTFRSLRSSGILKTSVCLKIQHFFVLSARHSTDFGVFRNLHSSRILKTSTAFFLPFVRIFVSSASLVKDKTVFQQSTEDLNLENSMILLHNDITWKHRKGGKEGKSHHS